MASITINVNGQDKTVDSSPDLALLWVLRDKLNINGPKYGCGINACKACTCLVNGEARTVCSTRVGDTNLRTVVTIEGLAESIPKAQRVVVDGVELHPVQAAWLDLDVAQCGFCQPGQIMAAVGLLKRTNNCPTDAQIDEIDNICRCGTYGRIRAAIKKAAAMMGGCVN